MYKIKEYREANNLSITELAKKVGITREYMSQIENNRVDNIGTKLLLSIARALGVSVTDILFFK